tara:strand:- start:181 stop:399 length:219 start_codon:yes stop_codon:yes gene_type:complete
LGQCRIAVDPFAAIAQPSSTVGPLHPFLGPCLPYLLRPCQVAPIFAVGHHLGLGLLQLVVGQLVVGRFLLRP